MFELLSQHSWLMCLAIFLARICDVSLGTMRAIVVFRGYIFLAALIGFFEVLIWIIATGHVLKNLDMNQWPLVVSLAAGYATGNSVGIWLESKLAMGFSLVRAFSPLHCLLPSRLREANYSVTDVQGSSNIGKPVQIILVVIKRKKLPELLRFIATVAPETFYTVEDIRSIHDISDGNNIKKHALKNILSKRK